MPSRAVAATAVPPGVHALRGVRDPPAGHGCPGRPAPRTLPKAAPNQTSARGTAGWRDPGQLGHDRGGRTRLRAGLDEPRSASSAGPRSRPRRARRAAPTTSTTSPRGGCSRVPRGELGGGAAHDLLVQLGQLAAHRDRALGVELGEHRERRRDPPRRLERDQRLGRGKAPARARRACAAGSRRTASGRPAARSRRAPRAPPTGPAAPRPRARRRRTPDEHEPGVGDQRHAGVGHQRDHRAVAHRADELAGALALVVLVVADEPAR